MLLDPPTRTSSAFETPSVTATSSSSSVNVAAANNNGVTPLMLAIRIGDTATFGSLMQRQQNLNLADNQGRTALHYAGAQLALHAVAYLMYDACMPAPRSCSQAMSALQQQQGGSFGAGCSYAWVAGTCRRCVAAWCHRM